MRFLGSSDPLAAYSALSFSLFREFSGLFNPMRSRLRWSEQVSDELGDLP